MDLLLLVALPRGVHLDLEVLGAGLRELRVVDLLEVHHRRGGARVVVGQAAVVVVGLRELRLVLGLGGLGADDGVVAGGALVHDALDLLGHVPAVPHRLAVDVVARALRLEHPGVHVPRGHDDAALEVLVVHVLYQEERHGQHARHGQPLRLDAALARRRRQVAGERRALDVLQEEDARLVKQLRDVAVEEVQLHHEPLRVLRLHEEVELLEVDTQEGDVLDELLPDVAARVHDLRRRPARRRQAARGEVALQQLHVLDVRRLGLLLLQVEHELRVEGDAVDALVEVRGHGERPREEDEHEEVRRRVERRDHDVVLHELERLLHEHHREVRRLALVTEQVLVDPVALVVAAEVHADLVVVELAHRRARRELHLRVARVELVDLDEVDDEVVADSDDGGDDDADVEEDKLVLVDEHDEQRHEAVLRVRVVRRVRCQAPDDPDHVQRDVDDLVVALEEVRLRDERVARRHGEHNEDREHVRRLHHGPAGEELPVVDVRRVRDDVRRARDHVHEEHDHGQVDVDANLRVVRLRQERGLLERLVVRARDGAPAVSEDHEQHLCRRQRRLLARRERVVQLLLVLLLRRLGVLVLAERHHLRQERRDVLDLVALRGLADGGHLVGGRARRRELRAVARGGEGLDGVAERLVVRARAGWGSRAEKAAVPAVEENALVGLDLLVEDAHGHFLRVAVDELVVFEDAVHVRRAADLPGDARLRELLGDGDGGAVDLELGYAHRHDAGHERPGVNAHLEGDALDLREGDALALHDLDLLRGQVLEEVRALAGEVQLLDRERHDDDVLHVRRLARRAAAGEHDVALRVEVVGVDAELGVDALELRGYRVQQAREALQRQHLHELGEVYEVHAEHGGLAEAVRDDLALAVHLDLLEHAVRDDVVDERGVALLLDAQDAAVPDAELGVEVVLARQALALVRRDEADDHEEDDDDEHAPAEVQVVGEVLREEQHLQDDADGEQQDVHDAHDGLRQEADGRETAHDDEADDVRAVEVVADDQRVHDEPELEAGRDEHDDGVVLQVCLVQDGHLARDEELYEEDGAQRHDVDEHVRAQALGVGRLLEVQDHEDGVVEDEELEHRVQVRQLALRRLLVEGLVDVRRALPVAQELQRRRPDGRLLEELDLLLGLHVRAVDLRRRRRPRRAHRER
mmetsp:Transcript_18427/g.56301  ORF Transcript_18427/g.56301 Transcript_18427/m.56301 type:complete len:1155 (+) Transcript_18427:300-3764(+)